MLGGLIDEGVSLVYRFVNVKCLRVLLSALHGFLRELIWVMFDSCGLTIAFGHSVRMCFLQVFKQHARHLDLVPRSLEYRIPACVISRRDFLNSMHARLSFRAVRLMHCRLKLFEAAATCARGRMSWALAALEA